MTHLNQPLGYEDDTVYECHCRRCGSQWCVRRLKTITEGGT